MAGIRKTIFLVHTILVISTWVICEHLTPSITDEANGVQLDDVVIKKINDKIDRYDTKIGHLKRSNDNLRKTVDKPAVENGNLKKFINLD